LDGARTGRQVALLVGDCGSGKSTLLAQYKHRVNAARSIGTAVLLHRSAVVNSPLAVARDLLRQLGAACGGGTAAALYLLRQRMREQAVEAVLVDDAQRLARHSLDFLRQVYEICGVAVILCGTPRFTRTLPARREELAHHVGTVHELQPLVIQDALALLNASAVSMRRRLRWRKIALARRLLRLSGGNVRRAIEHLEASRQLARRRHRALSSLHVEQSAMSFRRLAS
jgi:DNA transposition AAA+ family ATPase